MAEKLLIKNFGPITEASIDIKDMMVFIGKQATGKSCLAKIITILNDFNFRQNESVKLIEELEKYNIQSYLKSNTQITYTSPYFTFSYSKKEETKFDYEALIHRVSKFDNEKEKLILTKAIINLMLRAIIVDRKERILIRELIDDDYFGPNEKVNKIFTVNTAKHNIIDKLLEAYGLKKNINEYKKIFIPAKKAFQYIRPLDSLYIPAERSLIPLLYPNIAGLINNDIKIPKHILNTVQEYEKALHNIESTNIDIIGSYKFKRLNGSSYVYHNKNQKILLSESASGIQTLIPLILLIKNSIISFNYLNLNYVVEEPELNLYPEAQYELVKFLVENCLETDRNVLSKNLIITTHSPYILTSINNLLLSYSKGQINHKKANKIIRSQSWVNPNNFTAYEVKNGTVKRIFNQKSKLIEENIMDEVSDIIMDDFKKLAVIND